MVRPLFEGVSWRRRWASEASSRDVNCFFGVKMSQKAVEMGRGRREAACGGMGVIVLSWKLEALAVSEKLRTCHIWSRLSTYTTPQEF